MNNCEQQPTNYVQLSFARRPRRCRQLLHVKITHDSKKFLQQSPSFRFLEKTHNICEEYHCGMNSGISPSLIIISRANNFGSIVIQIGVMLTETNQQSLTNYRLHKIFKNLFLALQLLINKMFNNPLCQISVNSRAHKSDSKDEYQYGKIFEPVGFFFTFA